MSEKYKFVITGLIIMFVVIGWFGMFWSMHLSDIRVTVDYNLNIDMDEETLEWLKDHDYCMYNDKNMTFAGDCQYLNKNMLSLEVDTHER